MAARLTALLPRLLALTVIWLLGAATYTLAADTVPIAKHEKQAEAAAKPHVLTVPDVRQKAYVFAKGILQDAGFAWRVEGTVKGFSANTVTVQRPAPGTKVIDNGAPVVVLSLSRNTTYGESGLPENSAPYKATRIVLVSDWARGPDRAHDLGRDGDDEHGDRHDHHRARRHDHRRCDDHGARRHDDRT